jgi:hypothetical protein
MIKFSISIWFATKRPLAQETGAEFWKLGNGFSAQPGGRRDVEGRLYSLSASGQSMSLPDAIQVYTEAIIATVEKDGNNGVTQFVEITARVNE